MTSIAIIGGGLSGKLTGLYLARQIPDLDITIIDPSSPDLPIVGESTVEVTAQFLKSLGLGAYLEEEHLHKYGLTYYFRLPDGGGPDTLEYIQHEAPGVIRLPSYNLNRHTFDEELDHRISPLARRVTAKVTGVEAGDGMNSTQKVQAMTAEGRALALEVDHVVDCSGRARVLTKQFDLHQDAPYQRCSYWFRLQGFDREILNSLRLAKARHHCFDSYYVTHHFYGAGYWIWIIPMKDEAGADLVSFGITYRPDVSGEKAMNFDRLMEILRRDHPKLEQMVLSGHRVDQSRYFNYMYEATRYYDRAGRWFLVGDAGFTFDPANSAGIAYLGNQIPQVASMILKARDGALEPDYVEVMEGHLKAQLALQDQWSHWYKIMDDPIRMAWTLVVANMGYFHFVVPNFMTGAFLNAGVARQVARILKRYAPDKQPPVYPFPKVLDQLADTMDPQEIIRRAPALYEVTIPFGFYRPDDINRGRLIARHFYKSGWLRGKALRLLQWWTEPKLWLMAGGQYGLILRDFLIALVLFVRPRLYERAVSRQPAMVSAFDPPHAFLFPPEQTARARVDAVDLQVGAAVPAE